MNSGSNIDESLNIESSESRISDFIEDGAAKAIEALLFASPIPLTGAQLGRLVGCDKRQVAYIVASLNIKYMEWRRTFRIEQFGDSFRLYTLPEFDKYISKLAEIPRPARLSRAALEALAIIAYKQPLVKSEIERIRGIDSDGVIRTLSERGLIAICGRSDGPGRPLLYKTTQEFLEFFGISDLSQLPPPERLAPESEPGPRLTIVRPEESPGPDSN